MTTLSEDVIRVYILDAYNKLKTGSLIQLIASIMLVLSSTMLIILSFRFALQIIEYRPEVLTSVVSDINLIERVIERFSGYILTIFVVIIILIASIILWLISAWSYIIPGSKRLTYVDNIFLRASSLINLGWFWGAMVVFLGLGVMLGSIFSYILIPLGLSIVTVGFVLIILGYAGITILTTKLSDYEKIDKFETVSTLFILSIAIPFILFLPWLILYQSLQDSIKKRTIS